MPLNIVLTQLALAHHHLVLLEDVPVIEAMLAEPPGALIEVKLTEWNRCWDEADDATRRGLRDNPHYIT